MAESTLPVVWRPWPQEFLEDPDQLSIAQALGATSTAEVEYKIDFEVQDGNPGRTLTGVLRSTN